MTDEQAKTEVVRRWGTSAYAERRGSGILDIGNIVTPKEWRPRDGELKKSHGWGSTWEEAFALADQRPWSTKPYENTSKHTTKAGEEIPQMRLFP